MDFQISPVFFQGDPITALIFPAALFFDYVTGLVLFFKRIFSFLLRKIKGEKEVDVFGRVRGLKCWNFSLRG